MPKIQTSIFVSLAIILQLMLVVEQAQAVRIYRCYGRVQSRPCTSTGNTKETLVINRNQVADSSAYAKVISSNFSTLPKQEGIWRGLVAGNGTVHLRLLIKKNGIIQDTKYMGNVDLSDRSTTFAFRSVVPKGSDWSWDIEAYNG